MIELPLFKSIPKLIEMRIEAWDSDLSTSDDLIAKFVSTAMPVSSHADFQVIELSKKEETSYNTEVKIEASIKLTCSSHYYGEQCETYCKPDYQSFYCGENGERKCIPGWYGELCHKLDTCFLKPCAPYASCSNTDDEEGRVCYCNGGSGPECYQVHDPCNPSPCHNGGGCTKTGPHLEQFLCECEEPWYGPTCDQRHSACAWERKALASGTNSSTEVCLNGGVCKDNPIEFGYNCLCSSGWKGQHCEEPDYTAVIAAAIVTPIVLIMVAIFILLVWRTRWRSKIGRPSIAIKYGEQPKKYAGNTDGTERIEAVSNEIYGDASADAVHVETLSAEDEYAMLDEASLPQVVRKSYEGAVRYASLLWASPPDQSLEKATEDKAMIPSPPLVPPRPKYNEITRPLIREEAKYPCMIGHRKTFMNAQRMKKWKKGVHLFRVKEEAGLRVEPPDWGVDVLRPGEGFRVHAFLNLHLLSPSTFPNAHDKSNPPGYSKSMLTKEEVHEPRSACVSYVLSRRLHRL
uniref:Delta-like protein n=1 Tax=Echinococcus granulosus TaxID=6210 RepID=A0A068W8W4_ECHGR|nr:protein jagged 1 [Echinococcus granulosus]